MGTTLDIPFESIMAPKPQPVDTNKEFFNERDCSLRRRDEVQIFVQNIDGRILTLSTAKNTSILDCKKSIFVKTGIDIDEQSIYFEGKELKNGKSIYDYNINDESNINLSLKLKGGACTCFCLEWTGCCCEWRGCCCCKCRENYKCCCNKEACCLCPEAPCYCFCCKFLCCCKNSTCGFCCGGCGDKENCITRKINGCSCLCWSTE
eukprot:850292_1